MWTITRMTDSTVIWTDLSSYKSITSETSENCPGLDALRQALTSLCFEGAFAARHDGVRDLQQL